MQKTENPAGGRGSVLVLKVCVACETFLHRTGLAVKLWTLRWLRTLTSEMGMACSRWTDRLTIAIEGGSR
jgi:hypothetical protein